MGESEIIMRMYIANLVPKALFNKYPDLIKPKYWQEERHEH